jgi:hypothetical protein
VYPQYPGGGMVPEPSAPVPIPRSIRSAVNLMYAGAILSGLGAIAVIILLAVSRSSLGLNTAKVTVTVFAIVIAVLGLIEIGLWLWMAWAVKRGMGWARIMSSVLFGLSVVFTLLSVTRGGLSISGIVTLAIGLGAIIQLWRADSTAFFQAHRRSVG